MTTTTHKIRLASYLLTMVFITGFAGCVKQEPSAPATIGQNVSVEDSDWRVISALAVGRELSDPMGGSIATEGVYVKVGFAVRNKMSQPDALMIAPVVADATGRVYPEIAASGMYLEEGENSIMLEALNPNLWRTFWGIYELPEFGRGLRFRARSLGSAETFREISLDPPAAVSRVAAEITSAMQSGKLESAKAHFLPDRPASDEDTVRSLQALMMGALLAERSFTELSEILRTTPIGTTEGFYEGTFLEKSGELAVRWGTRSESGPRRLVLKFVDWQTDIPKLQQLMLVRQNDLAVISWTGVAPPKPAPEPKTTKR